MPAMSALGAFFENQDMIDVQMDDMNDMNNMKSHAQTCIMRLSAFDLCRNGTLGGSEA
jgi:hypothetical protein